MLLLSCALGRLSHAHVLRLLASLLLIRASRTMKRCRAVQPDCIKALFAEDAYVNMAAGPALLVNAHVLDSQGFHK